MPFRAASEKENASRASHGWWMSTPTTTAPSGPARSSFARTRTTGCRAAPTTARETEPTMKPRTPPSPREPRTVRSASFAAAVSSSAARPRARSVITSRSGWSFRARSVSFRISLAVRSSRVRAYARGTAGVFGHSSTCTNLRGTSRSTACVAAQRAAARLSSEPSRPTVTWAVRGCLPRRVLSAPSRVRIGQEVSHVRLVPRRFRQQGRAGLDRGRTAHPEEAHHDASVGDVAPRDALPSLVCTSEEEP